MRRSFLPVAAVLVACAAPEQREAGPPTELALYELSAPTLEIGVLDGAEEYLFGSIESVLRLGDGTVAVSDASNSRISVFDGAGTFLRSWGREGDGPGEFRSLSRLYLHGPDSILALDRRTSGLSAFALDGSPGRQLDGIELSEDSTFTLDSWLYGRFWVDGALTAESRASVRATIDRLPPPRLSPGYRSVRVARDGRLWIREPGETSGMRLWTQVEPGGRPLAVVEAPTSFQPLDVLEEEVLGLWLGESDVNFVRAYRLADSGGVRSVPAWLTGAESAVSSQVPPDEEELLDLMRQSIRMMASAQEIHYSDHYSYTTLIDSLTRFEQPEGIEIDFTIGNARGWGAVFTHPSLDRVCGLAYGYNIPPGWVPGQIVCGPESSGRPVDEG